MEKSYLLLGSNMGDRMEYLEKSREQLNRKAGKITKLSSVYESEPWGFDSAWFLNQVVEMETGMDAPDLLKVIHGIEQEYGRQRKPGGYQPRTIDIDILFYGDQVIDMPDLIIPHPRIAERMFVLVPMAELVPGMIHPVERLSLSDLKRQCPDQSIVKVIN